MRIIKKSKKADKKNINQFAIFICGSLFLALCLAGFSLWLYGESGAAQLDLSRPSYQEARKKAQEDKKKDKDEAKEKEFSASGNVDKKTVEEFERLYNDSLKKISDDDFKSGVLDDDSLNIDKEN